MLSVFAFWIDRTALFRFCMVTSPFSLRTNTILSPDFSFSSRRISTGTVICPLCDIFARFMARPTFLLDFESGLALFHDD